MNTPNPQSSPAGTNTPNPLQDPSPNGNGITSVSYTHLDVYKRQIRDFEDGEANLI